jgi:phosphoketolase
LLAVCVVGDGESEAGPLATSWHSNKYLNSVSDGAVLPILQLNGYRIAGPTVLARISHEELEELFRGYGYTPYFVEGDQPEPMHQLMAAALDRVVAEIRRIQQQARSGGFRERPRWPMIVLRSPKGWTGPKEVDGLAVEGTWRAHQVPIADMDKPEHVKLLDQWMRSYRPEELFDEGGRLRPELAALAPEGTRRMSANPHTNGGALLADLRLPDFRDYAVAVPRPGAVTAEATRVYLPPDANTLLSVTDHCLRSRNYVNVIVAGKQPAPQWLDMDAAIKHCTAGIGIWPWASNDCGGEPDVVMACCGDVPTLETLAAVDLLRQHAPELKIRVVNVVDLMKLQPASEHPHGLTDRDFDVLFTADKPIIFAFHGYPRLIHRLTYRRTNHGNLHVRGYKEEGTTTTPFDMAVMNDIDRFHLAGDVIDRLPQLRASAAYAKQALRDKLIEHKLYIDDHGDDLPEVRDWQWQGERQSG